MFVPLNRPELFMNEETCASSAVNCKAMWENAAYLQNHSCHVVNEDLVYPPFPMADKQSGYGLRLPAAQLITASIVIAVARHRQSETGHLSYGKQMCFKRLSKKCTTSIRI
jgi:hypothetical protein